MSASAIDRSLADILRSPHAETLTVQNGEIFAYGAPTNQQFPSDGAAIDWLRGYGFIVNGTQHHTEGAVTQLINF